MQRKGALPAGMIVTIVRKPAIDPSRSRTSAPKGVLAMKLAKATGTIQNETERVRVVEWRFPPGSETGHHVHEYDYVVVPIVPGTLEMVADDGTIAKSELKLGVSYVRHKGVSHNVVNRGDSEVAFVEVELKA